jgi:hypothetical protein
MYYIQLLAMALRTNLEAVTKSTMNFLGLFSFIYQYTRHNRCELSRRWKQHDETSANTPRFSYPYGTMVFIAAGHSKWLPNCQSKNKEAL